MQNRFESPDEISAFECHMIKSSENLKRHIVQIEILALSVVVFQAIILFQAPMAELIGPDAAYLLPFPFLAFFPLLAPVINPGSRLRAILKWGVSGLGAGATIGGAAAGAISGGLGAPAGMLIGGAVGFVTGACAGPFMEGDSQEILTQGEAREYLIGKRGRYPDLSLQEIIDATEEPPRSKDCRIYMFKIDGVIKCTKEEIHRWLKSGCWRRM